MSGTDNNCSACGVEIKEKQCAVVDTKKYHVGCFNCNTCQKPLAGQKFHKKNGEANCEVCHLEKFAPTCGGCQKKIPGKHLIVDDKKFHADCFVCSNCTSPFDSEGYYIDDDGKYCCQKCLALRRNRQCGTCSKIIETNEIFAMDQYFHNDCFKCNKCDRPLGDQSYINMENKPYHPTCLCTTCIVCGHQCDDQYYEVENNNISHIACIAKYDPKIHTTIPIVAALVVNVEVEKVHVEVVLQKQEPVQQQQEPVQQIQEPVQQVQAPVQQEEQKTQPQVQVVVQQPEQLVVQQPEQQAPVIQQEEQKDQTVVEHKQEEPKQSEVKVEASVEITIQPTEVKIDTKYQLKTLEVQEVNTLDPSCLDPQRVRYPLSELQKNPPPAGVPLNKKELYLSDEEFEKVFKMKMNRFLALKDQKRVQLKKQNNLF